MDGWGVASVFCINPHIQPSIHPFENWSARQELHLRSPGSRPGMLLLHHALMAPSALNGSAGAEKRAAETLGISLAVRLEIGAPGETCTHSLPADNGLLFYSAMGAKWWEMLVMLQFVASDTCFLTPNLQSGSRITSPVS